ncbi:MAG: hypothetical protein V2A66_06450 [Pseudomonadota bacterium]
MKKFLVSMATLSIVGVSACGSIGGSDNCPFNVSSFTNGANAKVPNSVWSCTNSDGRVYTIGFYDDKTGISSVIGVFTWSETGCQTVDVVASNGTTNITEATGSRASGIVTFIENSTITTACTISD